jgi:ubiquinone/menaquinone biosynthesis C-methylase UbiE
MSLPDEAREFYRVSNERQRLSRGIGLVERDRMRELFERLLPSPPSVVYDIGGGAGVHSIWLAGRGYQVHLLDIVAEHVEAARSDAREAGVELAGCAQGDALSLPWEDQSCDVALLMGPLYHLTERDDRLHALAEARRVLKPGGLLLAVGIPQHASTFVGLQRGWVEDDAYMAMLRREWDDGQHLRPPGWARLFSRAYFHAPNSLRAELESAGFGETQLLAIEGPIWMAPDFGQRWAEPDARNKLLEVARLLESDPGGWATSPHLLAVGRRALRAMQ